MKDCEINTRVIVPFACTIEVINEDGECFTTVELISENGGTISEKEIQEGIEQFHEIQRKEGVDTQGFRFEIFNERLNIESPTLREMVEADEKEKGDERAFADSFIPKGKYIWCLHCERVERRNNWVHNCGCPYSDCDGSPLDAWSWNRVANENEYPKTPKVGKYYPLYPQKNE